MNSGKIIELSSYRLKKQEVDQLARGRKPLFMTHKTASDEPNAADPKIDFAQRIARIRKSIESINELIAELKSKDNK